MMAPRIRCLLQLLRFDRIDRSSGRAQWRLYLFSVNRKKVDTASKATSEKHDQPEQLPRRSVEQEQICEHIL
jgi:hypothetical protein